MDETNDDVRGEEMMLNEEEEALLDEEDDDDDDDVVLEYMEEDSEQEEEEEEVNLDPLIRREGRILTDEEWQWSIELRQAIKDNEDLQEDMTDFEIAKHAIVAGGDLQAALSSVQRMQVFRDHYKIDHSVEQGIQYLQALMKQQPGLMVQFDVNENHESLNVMDPSCMIPQVALEGNNWRVVMIGCYYIHFVLQPSIRSIRQGFYAMLDFADISSKNFNMEVQYQMFTELGNPYPYKVHTYMAFNTGMMATMRISLAKAFMPQALKDKIQLGCQIEESDESRSPTQRLRDFYLLPNLEEAQKKMLTRARTLLEFRAYNEQLFEL